MEHEEILKSLDTLLKGSHMGVTTFSDPVSYTHLDVYKRQLLGNA